MQKRVTCFHVLLSLVLLILTATVHQDVHIYINTSWTSLQLHAETASRMRSTTASRKTPCQKDHDETPCTATVGMHEDRWTTYSRSTTTLWPLSFWDENEETGTDRRELGLIEQGATISPLSLSLSFSLPLIYSKFLEQKRRQLDWRLGWAKFCKNEKKQPHSQDGCSQVSLSPKSLWTLWQLRFSSGETCRRQNIMQKSATGNQFRFKC